MRILVIDDDVELCSLLQEFLKREGFSVEILGAKMLSPYVGLSHFVWTAQIAVTLVALACGYYVGGQMADRYHKLSKLYWALLAAAAYLCVTVLVCAPVAYWCLDFNLAVGSLLASTILFFVPLALLAMTTKELSATLPVVLLLVEIVFFGSTLRSAARRVWPFLLVVAVIPLLTFYAGHRVGDESVHAVVARGQNVPHPLDYLLTQATVLVMYLRLLVWPSGLNFDYDYPLYRSLLEPRVLASATLLMVLAAASVFLLVRARRRSDGPLIMAAFGVPWFLITSAIESSVVPLADLVDEYRLLVFPVVLGGGKRLFGEGAVPASFSLVASRTAKTGTLISIYRRAGALRTGSFALE